jgi:hypothetical protein
MPDGPYIRRRVTLPDGRRLSWSVRLERNNVGHFAIEGQRFDGWCDGWPLTDEELTAIDDHTRDS